MRTVVSDSLVAQGHYQAAVQGRTLNLGQRRTAAASARRGAADKQAPLAGTPDPSTPHPDDYLTKLAKYVPAETIAVILLLFGAFKPTGNAVWWWLAGGVVVDVIYLLSTAVVQAKASLRPKMYFYVLSAIAFVAWAIATLDSVATKMHITGDNAATQRGAILALAAFLIPALDTILARVRLGTWR